MTLTFKPREHYCSSSVFLYKSTKSFLNPTCWPDNQQKRGIFLHLKADNVPLSVPCKLKCESDPKFMNKDSTVVIIGYFQLDAAANKEENKHSRMN